MSKEYWLLAYDAAIEDLSEEYNLEFNEAENLLKQLLNNNPSYLDGYLTIDI